MLQTSNTDRQTDKAVTIRSPFEEHKRAMLALLSLNEDSNYFHVMLVSLLLIIVNIPKKFDEHVPMHSLVFNRSSCSCSRSLTLTFDL